MNRWIALAVSVMLFTGALAGALVVDQEVALLTRGIEYPLRAAALPEWLPRLGVNVDLLQYEPVELDRQLERMQSAGIRWLRQIVDWRKTEPAPSIIDWSEWDVVFAAISRYPDLSLVPVFFRTPRWASSPIYDDHPTLPPQDPSDLAAFAAAFARRYGAYVTHYQVWDEPNLYDAWGETPPSPSHYVAMLAAVYEAVRAEDLGAQIIAAALAPTTEDNSRNIMDWRYLREMYLLGASKFLDAAAGKPYGFNDSPEDRTVSPLRLNFSRVIVLREIMLAFGDAHKPLWLSEWGWNSLPSDWQGKPSIWGQVSPEQQITYTLKALSRIETEWPYVGGAVLSDWQPNRAPQDPRWGFALITPSGEPTPLLQAVEQRERRQLPSNGFYPPTVSSAQYSGLWTFGPLGADIGWLETSDSRASFQFHGRDVGLMLREGNFIAFLYPTVDGFASNALQRDSSGRPYILLRSDSQQPEVKPVSIAVNLPMDTHTLSIVADRGWDQWVLVGYLVSDGDIVGPLQSLRGTAWAVAAAALAALVVNVCVMGQRLLGQIKLPIHWVHRPAAWVISLISTFALTAGMLLSLTDGLPLILRRDTSYQLAAVVLSGGLLALELPAFLILSACGVLFVVFFHRPIIGISLTVLYAPFFLFPVELYRFAFPLSELLLLLTTAAAVLRGLYQYARRRQSSVSQFPHHTRIRWNAFDAAALAFLGLGAFALTVSANKSAAVTEFRTIILEPLVLYALIRVCVKPSQLVTLIHALLIGAVMVCWIGLVYFVTGSHLIIAEEGARRLTSVYGSPNNVALLLVRVIPLVAALAYFNTAVQRFIYAAACALFLITLVLTQSVGGLLLGLPASVFVVVWLIWRQRAYIPIVGTGAGLVVAAFIAAQLSPRFAGVFDFTEGTNFIRLRLWESSIAMVQDYPFTGIGLDQFLEKYRGTYVKPDAIWDSQLSHPHNVLLDVWLRLGLFGVVWMVGTTALIVRCGRHLLLQAVHKSPQHAVAIGILGALSGTAAHGMVDNSLFVIDLALIFWILLAILAQYQNEPAANPSY